MIFASWHTRVSHPSGKAEDRLVLPRAMNTQLLHTGAVSFPDPGFNLKVNTSDATNPESDRISWVVEYERSKGEAALPASH